MSGWLSSLQIAPSAEQLVVAASEITTFWPAVVGSTVMVQRWFFSAPVLTMRSTALTVPLVIVKAWSRRVV